MDAGGMLQGARANKRFLPPQQEGSQMEIERKWLIEGFPAGLPLVAVSWGFRSRRTLTEAGAETIADTAAELLEKLQ